MLSRVWLDVYAFSFQLKQAHLVAPHPTNLVPSPVLSLAGNAKLWPLAARHIHTFACMPPAATACRWSLCVHQ
jgi:hypothetical protein